MQKRVVFAGLTMVSAALVGWTAAAQQQANPRQQPGATITMFAPEQHDLYDGHYMLSANRIYMVGGLNDPRRLGPHGQRRGKTVKPVTGTRRHRRERPHEHGQVRGAPEDSRGRSGAGDRPVQRIQPMPERRHRRRSCTSTEPTPGCGDNNWPKTFVYLAGWGFGHATLNGKPLYDNYEMHFMVTQGIRDRKTLRVNYPMADKKQPRGEVNPATQQIDFYIRSPQQNPQNKPNREVFLHFFGMEVTWK